LIRKQVVAVIPRFAILDRSHQANYDPVAVPSILYVGKATVGLWIITIAIVHRQRNVAAVAQAARSDGLISGGKACVTLVFNRLRYVRTHLFRGVPAHSGPISRRKADSFPTYFPQK
jgi:hypothetical protein